MHRLIRTPLGLTGASFGALVLGRRALRHMAGISLQGKVVLITGASTGLGLQMARECAKHGARLAICARSDDRLELARQDLEQRGVEVLAVPTDVRDRDQVARLVERVVDRYGTLDVLICNAGVIQVGAFESMTAAEFESAMDGMFYGTLHTILAALPHLKKSDGKRLAIIASIGGKISVPLMLPYNAAKFALIGLGEGLRAELADSGVRVTTVFPGLIRTGSYLNAEFTGDADGKQANYRLFSTLSSLPVLTGDGESAARAYVAAIRRGDVEVSYPPQYQVLSRLKGMAPVLTTEMMSLVSRFLPPGGAPDGVTPGADVQAGMDDDETWRTLTAMGRDAIRRMQPWRAESDERTGTTP